MAVLWMDGFNHYHDFNGDNGPDEGQQYGYDNVTGLYEEVHSYSAGIYTSDTDKRAYIMGDKNYDHMELPLSNEQTVIVGWHAYLGTNWTGYPMLRFRESSTTQITLDGSTGRRLQVWRGNGDTGTLLGTAAAGSKGSGMQHHWVFIEMKVYFHSSAGTIEVRVDGETVIDLTNQNTISTANAYTDQLYWGYHERMWVDNLYVTDGEVDTSKTDTDGFLGAVQIITLMPNGDNSPNQWTRSAGTTNWENVDETGGTDPDLTYNYTGTSGNVDSYTLENLPTAGGTWTVIAVDPIVKAQRADSVSAQTITITAGSQVSAANNVAAVASVGLQWDQIHTIYDFETGTTDWTETTVNALTIDVEYD